jgi:SAM-dependent methyltransferase
MADASKVEFSQHSSVDAFTDPLLAEERIGNWRTLLPHLRCPSCGAALRETQNHGLADATGAHEWRVIGDLPWFAQDRGHYHADVPEASMRSLLARSLAGDWRTAFAQLLEELEPEQRQAIAENVLDQGRALGTALLPLGPHSRVLDIGCGWGSLLLPMAQRVELAVGLDLSGLRARFTQWRAHQDGMHNVFVLVGGDQLRLPFEDAFFDAVFLNGVLEWTPMTRPGEPWQVQRDYLSEIRRVLRPGGQVYIGIENRYSWLYFKAWPEDHVRLRFVSLLPRWLARPYVRWRRGHEYRVLTHGRADYRRLLREAGFGSTRIFIAHPNYRVPTWIFEESHSAALLALAVPSGANRWRRMLGRLFVHSGLFRRTAASYLVLGRNG